MDKLKVFISGITGDSPYHIYICQSSVDECYYIDTINENVYEFDVPKPFDNGVSYFIKVIDNNENVIVGVANINT